MRASLFLVLVVACGDSSTSNQKSAVDACTHLCQCETNTTDATCHTDCANAPPATGTSFSIGSWSSLSSSLSADPFGNVDQACIDCYGAASCASILAGTACTAECQ